jgi:hypothetical protein
MVRIAKIKKRGPLMKTFILITFALTMSSAHANTIKSVFSDKNDMHFLFKKYILETVSSSCQEIISTYGLSEVQTISTLTSIDDVTTLKEYTTVFSSRWYPDGMHPTTSQIVVKSSVVLFEEGDGELNVIKANIHTITDSETRCQFHKK